VTQPSTEPTPDTMSPDELRLRVIFSLLMPAARVALSAGAALKDVKHLMELALYQEARRRRLKMREMTSLLSISMSKVGLLSKQLKEHYARPDAEQGLQRKILTLLWSGPLSEQKIVQALGDDLAEDIRVALERMEADQRIEPETGSTVLRYKLGAARYRLVHAPWMARIDALNNLTHSVIQVVEARFFDNDPNAFARTLNFHAQPDDVDRLKAQYEQLFALICELDAATAPGDDSIPLQLSILWSPERDVASFGDDPDDET